MTLLEEKQAQLNRLGHRLGMLEGTLEKHSLTQQELIFVRTTLHFLNLQTRWNSVKPLDRFLITMQAALMGSETSQSESGFVGPSLAKLQQGFVRLMQGYLPRVAVGLPDLLTSFVQLTTFALFYVDTQLAANWKEVTPKKQRPDIQKAGAFFEELSLIFLFKSKIIEEVLKSVLKEIKINEKQQQTIAIVFRFYLLTLLFMSDASEKRQEQFEFLQEMMSDSLESAQEMLKQAHDKGILDDETTIKGTTYLQWIKRTLDNKDLNALTDTLKDSFQAFDLSYQEMQEDLKKLKNTCSQLRDGFNHIFFQAEKAMTTMDQAA